MSDQTTITQLFQSAQAQGELSKAAITALSLPDITYQIEEALGTPAIDIQSSEVFLVGLLIDDSGSIRMAGNSQLVREGHNEVLAAFRESKSRDGILVHARYLNGTILYPFVPLDQATLMTPQNYNPTGGTPLYDESLVFWATMLAKTEELKINGIPVRTASLILTDGHDEGSVRGTADDCCKVARDIQKSERHIIAALGIDDGSTNFQDVFSKMGIPSEWILTPGDTRSEIRKALQVWSRSTVRASQSAQAFSQVRLGGFATTAP